MTPVRVLLVDDHPVVRTGLRAALGVRPGIEVVAEASSSDEAVAMTRSHAPDVVLMDLNLGAGGDGADATRLLTALPDPPRVLVLTAYDSEADILRAVEAGAAGYLLKDCLPGELADAVVGAAAGETVLAPTVATRLLSRMRRPAESLTAREVEVLGMVAEGRSNAEIAASLFITQATVKSHLVQVFTKLGVGSRTAAVAAARERGLLR